MKISNYNIKAPIQQKVNIALVADLHNTPSNEALALVKECKPDIIAACGDFLMATYKNSHDGLNFLKSAADIAPTFFVLGNHENRMTKTDIQMVENLGVRVLDNEWVNLKGVVIGGINPVQVYKISYNSPTPPLQTEFLEKFEKLNGYKILLCHYPDYYEQDIKKRDIQLMLSGHTHGGQINLFGKGLYASGQGWFPKYFAGVYDNRLIISRGLSNRLGYNVKGLTGVISRHTPRIFNPLEVVNICLEPSN